MSTESFALPLGTATFLSAEVEEPDGRGQPGGDARGALLGPIEDLFVATVARHGGTCPAEHHHEGSFLAAFARASEALACSLEIQHGLRVRELGRLRIGLGTGEAQLREEVRYFGQAVARAARLRDLGHPGQILLSRASADLVADHLPPGASLLDLGSHRMRDLSRPEQVFQLVHPDLGADFAPLRSLDCHPHNLPVQMTSFVGREAAVEEVGELLGTHGLVTLTGSGGCGKTRLALQVSAEALGARKGESWFVDLSPLSDPALVPDAVMAAIGVTEARGESHTETLATWFADKDALVVLDNCEHVLGTVSELADALSRRCGRLALLATSREPLGVGGEVVWRVPCLSVPEDQPAVDIESLDAFEAVRLFRDRARAVRPNFTIGNENAPAVAAICQRLDGIPLAIELAAARVRMMSVEKIQEALADRFHLLAGGARSALPRQQALRASVDWSYELLPDRERALLCRLSVFSGGFTLDGAERVGSGGDVEEYEVLGLLSALVDKSLVQVNEQGDRYRLLETIREYGAQKLADAGDQIATRDRHLAYYLALGLRAEEGMWTSRAAPWLSVLDAEQANMRAALDWSLASGHQDTGARLLFAIANHFFMRCYRTEALAWIEQFFAREIEPARRADLYYWAAILAKYSSHSRGLRYSEELVELGRELGDQKAVGRGLAQMGSMQGFHDPAMALTTLEEALATARAVGDGISEVDSLCYCSKAYTALWRPRDVLRYAEGVVETASHIDFAWGVGIGTMWTAWAAREMGDFDRASDSAEALMRLGESLGDQYFIECAHWHRGTLAILRGDPSASAHISAALEQVERNHSDLTRPDICHDQGLLALALGREEEGCQILEGAIGVADGFNAAAAVRIRCLLAEAAIRRGDLERARRWQDELLALPLADELAHPFRARARLARARGDHQLALTLAEEGLGSACHSGARLLAVEFLELLALLDAEAGRYVEAGRLLGAADSERERIGFVRFAFDQSDVDSANARIADALEAAGSAAAAGEGRALSFDEAADYARRGRGERGRPDAGWASLTPTERGVVGLVLEGLTNAEIGARMFVSTATVKSHLTHIFAKLGVTNRRQLADAARSVIG